MSVAGNAKAGTAVLRRKLNRKTKDSKTLVVKTTVTPIPKKELGRLTLAYGMFQKGTPTMKKHNKNAPILTFFALPTRCSVMALLLTGNDYRAMNVGRERRRLEVWARKPARLFAEVRRNDGFGRISVVNTCDVTSTVNRRP